MNNNVGLFLAFFLLVRLVGFSQQRSQFTQHYINPYILNQAAGGTSQYLEASVGYRKQWVGFKDSPETFYASVFVPYNRKSQDQSRHSKKIRNQWNTFGASFYTDVTGPTSRSAGNISFAHNIGIKRDLRVSFAITGGMQQFSYNTSDLEIG